MAREFSTGFESGSLVNETSYQGGRIGGDDSLSGTARTGSYSYYVNTVANGWRGMFVDVPATDEFWIGFGFRTNQLHSNELRFFNWLSAGTSLGELRVCVNGDGRLYATCAAGSFYSTEAIVGAVWYWIELHVKIDDIAGVLQVRVDGNLWIDQSGIDTKTGAFATMDQFYLAARSNGATRHYLRWDDVVFNDTGGVIDNGWPGDRHLAPKVPNASGDISQWALFPDGGESDWEDVDELPPDDDVSYLVDGVDAQQFLVNLADWDGAGKSPLKVHHKCTARKETADPDQVILLAKQGGVTVSSAALDLLTSYTLLVETMDTAPDGGAWTDAKVDALQVGAETEI